ncbi:MAG: OmpA family protein [candidate division WOR-3 bacterium]
MKGFLNALGWIFFLLLCIVGLLFYNFSYLSKEAKISRLEQEIKMWTQRVAELTDSLRRSTEGTDTLFSRTFRFDELFESAESLKVSRDGEARLRDMVPQLRSTSGVIEVIGHTESKRSPALLSWPTGWEFSASAAAAAARTLISLGVPAERILVVGAADNRPAVPKTATDAQLMNRRVEITVRVR